MILIEGEKSYDHLNIHREKFDKIQHPFKIKNFQQTKNIRKLPYLIKGIYEKPTADIILNVNF